MAKKEAPIRQMAQKQAAPVTVTAIKTYTITLTEMSDGTSKRVPQAVGFTLNEAMVHIEIERELIMSAMLNHWGYMTEPKQEG